MPTPPASIPAGLAPSPPATPSLQARRIGIDTYRENVVYLRRDCPVVRAEGFQALAKVEVTANGRAILAVLNVVDDARLLGERELGLSEESYAQLGAAGTLLAGSVGFGEGTVGGGGGRLPVAATSAEL